MLLISKRISSGSVLANVVNSHASDCGSFSILLLPDLTSAALSSNATDHDTLTTRLNNMDGLDQLFLSTFC